MKKKSLVILFCLVTLSHGARWRRGSEMVLDAPIARALGSSEIRRKPPAILQALGPLAFGDRTGADTSMNVPLLGKLGLGDVTQTIAKFIPAGAENQPLNGGTFELEDKPNLGYMDRESTIGQASGTLSKMSFGGLGQVQLGDVTEKGSGILDFSKTILPFLSLPDLKNETKSEPAYSNIDPSLGELYYPKPRSYVGTQQYQQVYDQYQQLRSQNVDRTYQLPKEIPQEEIKASNPFDEIALRNRKPKKPRVHAVVSQKVEDKDLLESEAQPKEGFIAQKGKQVEVDSEEAEEDREISESLLSAQKKISHVSGKKPLGSLGLATKEVEALCAKFAPLANAHCYKSKVEPQFLDRCRGYMVDCAGYIAKSRPLGAIANSFSSGVGLSYYNWDVNGIPYYPVNEEGSVGNGHNGKVDFGSWGGGYSDNLGVRDYWSQTQEYGANWYEGLYGYKNGWSIPLVQGIGVEGGQGTAVSVPIKEGELGKPLSITNGYNVGPYIGLADRVGVDWMNGGVSVNRGFAVPFVGVGVNTGTAVGFPSIGTIMNRMGLNGVETLNLMTQAAAEKAAKAAEDDEIRRRYKIFGKKTVREPEVVAPIVYDPATQSILYH